jgi:hypothetical protein
VIDEEGCSPMKKKLIIYLSVVFALAQGVCWAHIPRGIGVFVLGKSIDEVKDQLKMETALPIRHREYLHEVQIKPMEGFKSGFIWYGTSTTPGRIVRIKLKYADSSKIFFQALLKQFKQRFGKPTEWRGDPFHVLKAWKWSFTDIEKNQISLILQHNVKDPSQKLGNCVKLTMWNLIEDERRIHERKHPQSNKLKKHQEKRAKALDSIDWDRFVPR